jgi:hypothetical protein
MDLQTDINISEVCMALPPIRPTMTSSLPWESQISSIHLLSDVSDTLSTQNVIIGLSFSGLQINAGLFRLLWSYTKNFCLQMTGLFKISYESLLLVLMSCVSQKCALLFRSIHQSQSNDFCPLWLCMSTVMNPEEIIHPELHNIRYDVWHSSALAKTYNKLQYSTH